MTQSLAALPALALALALLAGCGGGGAPASSARARCEAAADADPVVKREQAISAGNLDYQWQQGPAMRRARDAAIDRCLSGGGAIRRGGVERRQ